jgi:hypothetical protein
MNTSIIALALALAITLGFTGVALAGIEVTPVYSVAILETLGGQTFVIFYVDVNQNGEFDAGEPVGQIVRLTAK